MRPRPLLALALLAAAGCGPEDGPRRPVPAGYEGDIQLSRFTQFLPGEPVTEFLYAQVEFYFDPENLWLDAGASVRLAGPNGELRLVRTELPGKTVYQKEQGTDIDPDLFVNGATYAMEVAGSRLDYGVPAFDLDEVLTLPQAFSLTAPDIHTGELLIAADATSLALSWIPGDGEYVDIIFAVAPAGGGAEYVTYRVADDGGFDVPNVGLSQIPAGEGVLTIARKITTALQFPEEGFGEGLGADAIQCRIVRE